MSAQEIVELGENQLPVIAYVDEKEDERDNFFNDAYDSGLFSEIHLIEAHPDIEKTLSEIQDKHIDAFITDFNLTEEGPVGYNGAELVSRLLSVRHEFPCFIRTSYEEDALAVSLDVNRVYSKKAYHDEHSALPIFRRISLQIEKYQETIKLWKSEHERLLKIPTSDRSAEEIDELLEIDGKLEAAFGADATIPKSLKEELFSGRVQMHEEAEKLIQEIKKELGE